MGEFGKRDKGYTPRAMKQAKREKQEIKTGNANKANQPTTPAAMHTDYRTLFSRTGISFC